jgi:citrate synthase
VKTKPQVKPTTRISTSNSETILVRGHDLCAELMGKFTFTDHIWLLVAGSLPSAAQRHLLDSTLLAIAEHGLVASVVASRITLVAAPDALQGAVAAGILGCGSVVLGTSETAGRLFEEVIAESADRSVEAAAREVVGRWHAARRAIAGYGHPLHKTFDPRAKRLLEIAREEGVSGRYAAIAETIEQVLPGIIGRPLRMNVSGAIPAVLLDAGYPLLALKGVPILARTASLIAHLLEEQQNPIGFILAHEGASAVTYEGPKPPGFVGTDLKTV